MVNPFGLGARTCIHRNQPECPDYPGNSPTKRYRYHQCGLFIGHPGKHKCRYCQKKEWSNSNPGPFNK